MIKMIFDEFNLRPCTVYQINSEGNVNNSVSLMSKRMKLLKFDNWSTLVHRSQVSQKDIDEVFDWYNSKPFVNQRIKSLDAKNLKYLNLVTIKHKL